MYENVIGTCGIIPGYLEVVHDAFLSEGGQQCIATIKLSIDDTIRAMETEGGRRELESAYR